MRKLVTSSTAVAVLALATAVAATAAKPVVTETQVNRTRVLAASPETCPFDFVIHTEGVRRDTVYSDGRVVTILHDFHVTYTNPVSGRSVSTPLGGPVIVKPNADGTVTVTVNGNDGRFTDEGEGLVFADLGRLVYVADPADIFTPLEILQATGHQDTALFPAVCSALE
jgi:hypothetical protein